MVIERYWTKTQILETYLNVIEFGEGVFGIQNASLHYFHKDCSQLTTKESLWLVSILPNPKKLSKASDSWHASRSNELCRRMPFSDLSFLDPKNLNERIATSYQHRLTIVYALARKNPHYRAKRPLQPKGLMLHSVGFPQPRAKPHMAYQNRKKYTRACVHGFLDAISGITYQTIRWNRRAAHAGGEANNTHLGIELCEPQTIQYLQGADWIDLDPVETKKVVLFTYNQAVKLFAHLCEHLNLNPLEDGVIISHSEGFKRGIASDHKDVEHLWNHFGLSMDQFRRDVAEQMEMSKDDIFVEYITPEHAKSRMIE